MSRAAAHLISLQRDQGNWEGEVVWCTMILSQYVIVRHVTGRPVSEESRQRIVHHYTVTRTADGGWPLHPDGPPQIFTTALAYVALRMLGTGPDDALVAPARAWLRRQPGGLLGIPTWGKFWLSLLDLYAPHGVAALPPELFLLPRSVPGHPRGWYCHTRYIYLAMSYLSGCAFKADLGPLRDALRCELYVEPYDAIDFAAHRSRVSRTDLYAQPALALSVVRPIMLLLARSVPRRLRKKAQRDCFARILHEQRTSRYQALSPVNGLLNCLAIYATDRAHPELEPSLDGLEAWRWCDEARGIRYAGARSQVWDTAFTVRALLAGPAAGGRDRDGIDHDRAHHDGACQADVARALHRGHAYLKRAQLVEELPNREAEERDSVLGGWCFSDGAHRWPVSDCAAEALTAVLAIERVPGIVGEAERLPTRRVREAVTFVTARQNADGGFSTYEPMRGGAWLDRLNPSEMFRGCMTDRSYVECTASAVEALATVRKTYPDLMPDVVGPAIDRGVVFLRRSQSADGTFPSAWGINFTYSLFHVTKALRAADVERDDPALARAARWLRRTQRADGGWGEHFSGCLEGTYVEHSQSQAVMTSWALLALAEMDPGCDAVDRGLAWLESAQRPDGSWPHEAVNGVFFGTAMLDYSLYVSYFPVWAIARCTSAA